MIAGRKVLLKYEQITIFVPPPRIKELYVKDLWNELKNDGNFKQYFTNRALKTQPNRKYFFTVLATVYKEQYIQLLKKTQNKRKQLEAQKNRAVLVDHEMLSLIDNLMDLSLIRGSKKTKRICTTYPKRNHKI